MKVWQVNDSSKAGRAGSYDAIAIIWVRHSKNLD